MNQQRKAIITGATGYIGSRLAGTLVKAGWEVHLIIRPGSGLALLEGIKGSVSLHEHDGSTEVMQSIVASVNPSLVFHLASLFKAGHGAQDIAPLIRSNILFGTQLLQAMAECGVEPLVTAGTSWQHYGNKSYSPVNLYAATKQAFDDIVRYYAETTPLRVITLKLFDTYGPGDPREKLFALLKKVAVENMPLAMSPGEQLLDIVYIDDVIDAFLLAAERLMAGRVDGCENYAVSSGAPITLRELVELYGLVIGKKLPVQWGARPYRSREVMEPWNNGALLPGWQPRVSLEEGIRKSFLRE